MLKISSFLIIFFGGQCFAYEDLIIERRTHHVDWDDLFMEYNRYSAPDRETQQINISIDITAFQPPNRIVFELYQKWKDERLRFVGTSRATVPSHVKPWVPDTYIRNGINSRIDEKSLSLSSEGIFVLKEKYQVELASSEEDFEKFLIISSFDNYGTIHLHYHLENWHFSNPLEISDHLSSKNLKRRSLDDNLFEDLLLQFSAKPSNSTLF